MCLVHHCPASQNCDLRRSKEEAGVWVRWHRGFEVLGLGFWVLVRIEAVWGLEGSGFVGWVWCKFSGVEPVSERSWSEALIPPRTLAGRGSGGIEKEGRQSH